MSAPAESKGMDSSSPYGIDVPAWSSCSQSKWLQVLLEHVAPGCVIGMEACGDAHHWAREL